MERLMADGKILNRRSPIRWNGKISSDVGSEFHLEPIFMRATFSSTFVRPHIESGRLTLDDFH